MVHIQPLKLIVKREEKDGWGIILSLMSSLEGLLKAFIEHLHGVDGRWYIIGLIEHNFQGIVVIIE